MGVKIVIPQTKIHCALHLVVDAPSLGNGFISLYYSQYNESFSIDLGQVHTLSLESVHAKK